MGKLIIIIFCIICSLLIIIMGGLGICFYPIRECPFVVVIGFFCLGISLLALIGWAYKNGYIDYHM